MANPLWGKNKKRPKIFKIFPIIFYLDNPLPNVKMAFLKSETEEYDEF
jgi:hypothetical protein